jgi:hypothetical protein
VRRSCSLFTKASGHVRMLRIALLGAPVHTHTYWTVRLMHAASLSVARRCLQNQHPPTFVRHATPNAAEYVIGPHPPPHSLLTVDPSLLSFFLLSILSSSRIPRTQLTLRSTPTHPDPPQCPATTPQPKRGSSPPSSSVRACVSSGSRSPCRYPVRGRGIFIACQLPLMRCTRCSFGGLVRDLRVRERNGQSWGHG